MKVFPTKWSLLTNPWKFSPLKVSHYTIWLKSIRMDGWGDFLRLAGITFSSLRSCFQTSAFVDGWTLVPLHGRCGAYSSQLGSDFILSSTKHYSCYPIFGYKTCFHALKKHRDDVKNTANPGRLLLSTSSTSYFILLGITLWFLVQFVPALRQQECIHWIDLL